MALMVCRGCGTKFAVGLHRCPQCTAEDAYMDGSEPPGDDSDEEDDMPKITVHGGASNAAEVDDTEGGEQPSPGNSSSTSPEKPQTTSPTSEADPRQRARGTGSRSKRARAGSSTAGSTATSGPETDADKEGDES